MANGLYNDQDLLFLVNSGVSPNVANDQDLAIIVQQRLVPALIHLQDDQELMIVITQNHYKVPISGTWQYPDGTPVAKGTLTVQLNYGAMSVDGKQVDTRLASTTLDSTGSIPAGSLTLYPNALLTNDGMGKQTKYLCSVYTATGLLIWQQPRTVTTGSL